MAKFSVNTHHAYLNNDIVLYSDEPVQVVDDQTGVLFNISKQTTIHLAAGKHILSSEDHDEEIIIEDAIKLGGGRIKNAFVFDDNPWCFVTTKDRLYIYNRESKEERVEYNITPDDIMCVECLEKDSPSTFFVFKTKEDFSIFDVETGRILYRFSGHIYSNGHLVIYKTGENVFVYNFLKQKCLLETSSQFSISNKFFYFVKNLELYSLSLSNDNIIRVDVGNIYNEMYILTPNCFIKLLNRNNKESLKKYRIYSLNNEEKEIKINDLILPYYISTWEGVHCKHFKELEKNYYSFYSSNQKLFESNSIEEPQLFSVDITQYIEKNEKGIIISGRVCIIPKNWRFKSVANVSFVVKSKEFDIHFNNAKYLDNISSDSSDDKKKTDEKNNQNDNVELDLNEIQLGKSLSKYFIITKKNEKIYLRNLIDGSKEEILVKYFDPSIYSNAYFSSDGKSVVLQISKTEAKLLGFDDFNLNPFEVDGFTVARNEGFNGYKPEITILDGRIPVWRDPITLETVSSDNMSKHIFMSPDKKYVAEINKKTIIFNRLTKKETTEEERTELRNKYNWGNEIEECEKIKKIELRKQLVNSSNKEVLFGKIIEQYTKNANLIEKETEERINTIINNEIERYINKESNFVALFLDRLSYVCYRENKENSESKEILIGRSVYFLNFVSFSYDSKFLSFAAKMNTDEFRHSQDGVFVIYDIEKDKIVKRIERYNDEQLWAVWMTMFSKKGDVAFYDSKADAFLVSGKSDYKQTERASGKSLLCFSPSGKYIAFSDQKYIDYTHHPNENWGHQPSGNIFIHATDDFDTCLEHYNDFGEGIEGVAWCAGDVASAAFSQDEKRLLAVGKDGVVVIRNLKHTDTEIKDDIEYYQDDNNSYGDDYGTHYGEFAGSYAQDVMGFSDDVINDAFDGDPDAYWNID